MERYECIAGSARKFWTIEIAEAASLVTVRTTWGRIGTEGQSKTFTFASTFAAAQFASKKTTEKLGKGYRRQPPIANVDPRDWKTPDPPRIPLRRRPPTSPTTPPRRESLPIPGRRAYHLDE